MSKNVSSKKPFEKPAAVRQAKPFASSTAIASRSCLTSFLQIDSQQTKI
jgi:hypothetical protein